MAYIKDDGTIGYNDIFNLSVMQTDEEILAMVTAQKAQVDESDRKIAAKKAVYIRLGATADEIALLLS